MESSTNGKEAETHFHSNGLHGDLEQKQQKPRARTSADLKAGDMAHGTDIEEMEIEEVDFEEVENYLPTPPDGQYGWVIVFASFMLNVLVDGVAYTFGVMLPTLSDSFKEPKSKISLVGSLLCGVYLFVGPFAGALVNKFSCRTVVVIGSVVATAAFLGSAFSKTVDVMIVSYGVAGGAGVGLIYLPSIVIVSYYFEKRRALATGIAVCGSGVGTFMLPPLLEFLMNKYAWQGTIIILAGTMFQCMLFGFMMRPLELKAESPKSKKPRAKNILDRVKETAKRNHKNMANLISSIPDIVIKEGVQQAKLKRQQSIQDSDSYITSSDSLMLCPATTAPANQNLEAGDDTKPPERMIKTFIIRAQSEEGETISEDVIRVDSSKLGPIQKRRRHHKSKERLHNHSALEVPGVLPGGMGGSRTNLSSLSHMHSMRSINLSVKDLARPLYRKDIFYSGSVLNIQDVQGQENYRANVTTIPGESELVARPNVTAKCINFCCGCLPRPVRDVLNEMIDLSLFLDPSFMLLCLGNMTTFLGFFVPYTFLVDYAKMGGIGKADANWLISIIGIANIVGRIVIGFFADFRLVDSLVMAYVAIAVSGVSTILFPLVTGFIPLCVLAATFGLGVATFVSLSSIVICDQLGLEKLTNGFGLLSMARGMSSIAGPPFAGYMYDSTKSYAWSFTISGALMVAGAVCHAFLHLPCLKTDHQRKNKQHAATEDEGIEMGPLLGSKPVVVGPDDIPNV